VRSKQFPVAIVDHGRNHYELETKQQSMEWRHSGSTRSALKNSKCKNPPEKFSSHLPKSQIINAEYYLSLLVQLKDILRETGRGKVTKWVLFLHDNAPAHWALATQKKLAYLGFQCLDSPPYSPDLVPSDY